MAELVLSIPTNPRGLQALEHLHQRGMQDLRCSYIGALSDRLKGLESLRFVQNLPHSFHLVFVPDGDEVAAINRILAWHNGETEGRGLVEAAEPNVRLTLSANLGVPFTLGGKHTDYRKQMRLDKLPTGVAGAGVRVAVVDSGLDGSSGVTPVHFFDVEATPPGPRAHSDNDGHGTAMTTLIHAVAPDTEISVVRALDPSGSLPLWNLLAALPIAAYDCRAAIVNLSLGFKNIPLKCPGCGATVEARLLAFDKLLEGIAKAPHPASGPPIYVAATGNEASSQAFNFPALQADMVAVGSVTSTGARSTFSNYGTPNHKWYLMAPGGEATVASGVTEHVGHGPSGEPCRGTSVATAYASGMLALLRSETRYQTMPRDAFLDHVVHDHCERPSSASVLEYGSGKIVYIKTGSVVTTSPQSPDTGTPRMTIECFDDSVVVGGVRIKKRESLVPGIEPGCKGGKTA